MERSVSARRRGNRLTPSASARITLRFVPRRMVPSPLTPKPGRRIYWRSAERVDMKKHFAIAAGLLLAVSVHAAPKKALIVDGQNNHAWKETTPVLKKLLEETGLFTVDVTTTPPK